LTSRIKDIGKIVTERDVNKARERDAKLLDLCNGNVKPMPRQDMQPPLSAGLLASPVRPAHGTIFPQPWLVRMDGSRVRMDDLLGHGWRLIARDARYLPTYYPLQQIYGMNVTAACLGEEGFCEEEGVVEAWFERYAANAVLVRPDNYVYGVAQSASDLEELLNHISLNTQAETASF
jgi:3-(3-hydroxy-phenyl)propionate hydroxylase